MFNREIYYQNLGQTEHELIAEKRGELPERRKNELDALSLAQLHKNKRRQLEKIISDAQNVMNIYSKQLENDTPCHRNSKILESLSFTIQILAQDKISPYAVGALAFGKLVGEFIKDPPHISSLKTKMALFENKIEILRRRIDEGHIPIYEKRYAQIKRLIAPNLQDQIEEELIQGYNSKDSYFTLINKKFIDLALALPYRPMQIYKDNIQEDDSKLRHNFHNHNSFKNYPEELRTSLLEIARKIAFASCESEDTRVALRGVYYLEGNPGCGKSQFCSELARFLGIPFFETSIRSSSDLAMGRAEGSSRYNPQANPGWFVKALLGNQPSGHGYNNGLLVLNDFDRVMKDPQALNFMLDYLDPARRKIYLPFFDVEHGFARLSVILTANSSIPTDKIHEALRSRIPIIKFTDFTKAVQIKIVNEGYLTDLFKHYAFPSWIKVKYTENEKLRLISSIGEDHGVYSVDLNQTMAGVDLRVRKAQLDREFNQTSSRTSGTAETIFGIAMGLFNNLNASEAPQQNQVINRYNHMGEAIRKLDEVNYDPRVHLGIEAREVNSQNNRITTLKEEAATIIAQGNFTPLTLQELNFKQTEIIKILSGYQGNTQNPIIMILAEAANLGLVKAANEIGKIYLKGGELETSKYWFNLVLGNKEIRGFKEPVLEALRNLKDILSRGNNDQEKLNCTLMAANLGDAESQFELGKNFYDLEQYSLAKKYFNEAANNGHLLAQQKMGKLNPLIQDNTTLVTLLNNSFEGLASLLTSLDVSGIGINNHFSDFIRVLGQMKTLEKLTVLKTDLPKGKIVGLTEALIKMDNLKNVSLTMPYSLSYTIDLVTDCSRDLWQEYNSPNSKLATPIIVLNYVALPVFSTIGVVQDILSTFSSQGGIMHPASYYGKYFSWAFYYLGKIPNLENINMHLLSTLERKDILRESFNADRQNMNLPAVKIEFM